jgi:hypothetical protein
MTNETYKQMGSIVMAQSNREKSHRDEAGNGGFALVFRLIKTK